MPCRFCSFNFNFNSASCKSFASESSSSSLVGNLARRDFADGVLPADEVLFLNDGIGFEWVIGVNGEICFVVWFETWVETDTGGGCTDGAGRSSSVKKRKAPLLVDDTGTGIFDEILGDWIRLKQKGIKWCFRKIKSRTDLSLWFSLVDYVIVIEMMNVLELEFSKSVFVYLPLLLMYILAIDWYQFSFEFELISFAYYRFEESNEVLVHL